MRRAVLIGGTGMIGRAAAAALARDGWEVVALSRSGDVSDELAALGVRGAAADRADDAQLRRRSATAPTSWSTWSRTAASTASS